MSEMWNKLYTPQVKDLIKKKPAPAETMTLSPPPTEQLLLSLPNLSPVEIKQGKQAMKQEHAAS